MARPVALTEKDEQASSHIVDLGWTKVHYNDVGSGDPIILIHGGGLGASSWSNFILNIGELSKSFRVLAVDCPGYGKSAPLPPSSENRPTLYARAIKGLIDALGIKKVSLVGNSQGGATSFAFAVDYPDSVNKVIAMGPAPVGQRDVMTPRMPTEGTRALIALPRDPSFANFRKLFDMMVHDPSQVPDDVLKVRAETVDETHRANMLASQTSPSAFRNMLDDLAKLKTPMLIIQGRNDTIVTPNVSLMLLPYLQNAEFHMFNNCGHWAQYEHAGKFNRMVTDYLLNDD